MGFWKLVGLDEVNPDTGETYSCIQQTGHFMKSPWGQVFTLIVFTVPLGIWSIVVAQDSFDILDGAVGNFNTLLDTWKTPPFTNITVVGSSATCPDGFTLYAKPPEWPGSKAGPCACPAAAYQPFNTATNNELNAGLSSVFGRKEPYPQP